MDASSAVFISQLSRMLVQGGSCSKDCQAMVLKHPASSQEEHGAPAGTRTPIDGLGNRSSIQLSYRSALNANNLQQNAKRDICCNPFMQPYDRNCEQENLQQPSAKPCQQQRILNGLQLPKT